MQPEDMYVCVCMHVLEHKNRSAAIRLEDSTSPPPPLSSSCSLLSGGTRGAGLNYVEEVDCDTDAGRGDGVSRPGPNRARLAPCCRIPETKRAIADHLLPLPSQQSRAQGQIALCMCMCENATSSSLPPSYSIVTLLFLPLGPHANTSTFQENGAQQQRGM